MAYFFMHDKIEYNIRFYKMSTIQSPPLKYISPVFSLDKSEKLSFS